MYVCMYIESQVREEDFRQSLLNTTKKWSLMFKQYLIDSVIGGLSNLEAFIAEAKKGLGQPLREGDLTTLISVMGWLQKLKDRQATTDFMFEPLKEYIEFLKSYDYEMPESVYIQLEELPVKWNNLKKFAVQVKHQVAPLQAQPVSNIRKRISDFDAKQNSYRERFKTLAFFKYKQRVGMSVIKFSQIEYVLKD